jgi:hypothetical protein
VDAVNYERSGRSMWRGQGARFLLVVIPASVLYWLLFEWLNLFAPQWRYRGPIDSLPVQVLFGFVSFATVIPIMVQAWWLVAGEISVPAGCVAWAHRYRYALGAAAVALLAMPLFNDVFWWNQGMWIAPALAVAPFLPGRAGSTGGQRFLLGAVAAGILAGVFWEGLNYWAVTQWEYLILPSVPHLFEMPVPGYLGFIPFGVTTVVVYTILEKVPARSAAGAILYGAAVSGLWYMTATYAERGFWVKG